MRPAQDALGPLLAEEVSEAVVLVKVEPVDRGRRLGGDRFLPGVRAGQVDGADFVEGGSRNERTRDGWYYWGMQEETARSAIDTFISAFNASDDSYVTALLSQALTSDVVFWGPLGRSEGIAAVERFVLDIRRHPAGTGTMVRCSAVDMPDEWARYQWVFTTPDGGPRLTGTDVVHLRRSLIDQVIVFAGEIEPSAS